MACKEIISGVDDKLVHGFNCNSIGKIKVGQIKVKQCSFPKTFDVLLFNSFEDYYQVQNHSKEKIN